jgi:hypothetical protein
MMTFKTVLWSAQARPLLAAAGLCAIPYLGLVSYVFRVLHSEAVVATTPSPAAMLLFVITGGLLPLAGLALVLSRLARDRTRFRLSILLQSYLSLILVFATLYGLLQVSHATPAFGGMLVLWDADTAMSAVEHLSRLHAILGDALYLSVITITTVGYGDLAPISPVAKLLSASEGLAGIAFMGLALGHYFSTCTGCTGCAAGSAGATGSATSTREQQVP